MLPFGKHSLTCLGKWRLSALLSLGLGLLSTLHSTQSAPVTVFAAASLSDVLEEIAAGYEESSRAKIRFNFASSSFLARQIEEGAPADLFFSADTQKMDRLAEKGLIDPSTRREQLSNSLVIVARRDSSLRFASARDLTNTIVRRIALADPQSVPAGIYARAYLDQIGLWTALEKKLVRTDNVRAALAAVESGNVDAGIVYRTDAAISTQVRVLWDIPPAEGPRIRYAVALLSTAPAPDAARTFLKHLDSARAAALFKKHGFILVTSPQNSAPKNQPGASTPQPNSTQK